MAAGQIIDAGSPGVVQAARVARRIVAAAAARPAVGGALRSTVRLLDGAAGKSALMPAAVRIERSRARGRRGEVSEQTALTLWFGEGPALPGPGAGRTRLVAGTALAVVGAAAIGAATYLVNQRETARVAPAASTPLIPPATAARAS